MFRTMRRGATHNATLGIMMAVMLSGCVPAVTDANRTLDIPSNPGRRLDLRVQVDGISGASNMSARDVENAIGAVWSESESLRSWFTLVERPTNAAQTVFLAATVNLDNRSHQISGDSDWTMFVLFGIPPGVRSNSLETRVSISLIDASTGIVLASGFGQRVASGLSLGGAEREHTALRAALIDALEGAMRAYAGR